MSWQLIRRTVIAIGISCVHSFCLQCEQYICVKITFFVISAASCYSQLSILRKKSAILLNAQVKLKISHPKTILPYICKLYRFNLEIIPLGPVAVTSKVLAGDVTRIPLTSRASRIPLQVRPMCQTFYGSQLRYILCVILELSGDHGTFLDAGHGAFTASEPGGHTDIFWERKFLLAFCFLSLDIPLFLFFFFLSSLFYLYFSLLLFPLILWTSWTRWIIPKKGN